MSTESRRARTRRRRTRGFLLSFVAVLGALVLAGAAGAAVAVAQGPRVTGVQVDPAAAVEASGARVILTTTQALREIDPGQVEVEPATPFTIDTSGRSIGLRFTLPLRDDAEYTVRVRDVRGLGAGPAATLEETFRTPPLALYLLQRGDGSGDTIYRTSLEGTDGEAVFTHPHIEDYRRTAGHLVVSVLEDDSARLLVVDLDSGDVRELALPGEGHVSNLQAADRGERIGYTYSDAALGSGGGQESVLYTASLSAAAADDEPTALALSGDARIAEWRFVPDTDRILALSFDGRLVLTSPDGAEVVPLGSALAIEGIARGSSEAIVERLDGMRVIDLTDTTERELPDAADVPGFPGAVTPVPGGGTVRTIAEIDERSAVAALRVVHVDDDGASTVLFDAGTRDAVLHTCVSPSGRYAAVLVAPDAADNPFDTYRLPLPQRLETHIIEIADGSEVVALGGSHASWCLVPPA